MAKSEPPAEPRQPLSPKTQAILALVQGLLPAMTAIIGGLWVAFTYIENQHKAQVQNEIQAGREAIARSVEARKPFLTKKHELYFETMRLAGLLTYVHPSTPQWTDTVSRFLGLRYSDMQMVGNASTRARMRMVLFKVYDFQANPTEDAGWKLRGAIECLA